MFCTSIFLRVESWRTGFYKNDWLSIEPTLQESLFDASFISWWQRLPQTVCLLKQHFWPFTQNLFQLKQEKSFVTFCCCKTVCLAEFLMFSVCFWTPALLQSFGPCTEWLTETMLLPWSHPYNWKIMSLFSVTSNVISLLYGCRATG